MLKLRFNDKEHGDIWLVEPGVLVGADASCQAVVKREGIQGRHIEIKVKGDQLQLVNLCNDKNLKRNGKDVSGTSDLNIGDEIQLAGMTIKVVDPKQDAKPVMAVATSEWAIKPNHSALANKIYPIQATTVIGRAPECDLNFSVTHLSRRHAELFFQNGSLMVKDLGSANGTFVNGKQIQAATKLNKGDELRLDTLSFAVIGPSVGGVGSGDADKTVMRAAVSVTPATAAAPVSAPAHAPAQAQVVHRDKKVAGVSALNRAVSAGEVARDQAESSASIPVWIMVAVALLVVAAVLFYIMTGDAL